MVRDPETNEPIVIQKIVTQVPKTMIYCGMCEPVDKGGFDGARNEEGTIVISETAMRRNWPNFAVAMTTRYKATCVCDKCGVPTEVHESLNYKRRKVLNKLKTSVARMNNGRRKSDMEAKMKAYEEQIMEDGKLKYDRMSKLIEDITCPPIEVEGISMNKFECVIGDCQQCKDKYQPLDYEKDCVDSIKYNLYSGHRECTWHGDSSNIVPCLDEKGKTVYKCTKCEDMDDEEREKWLKQKKPATVKSSKWKVKKSEPLQDFVKVNGVYHDLLLRYRLHRFHRIFLGTKVALKMIRKYNKDMVFRTLMIQSDYSEKYQPQPDGQFQSQYFDKHGSVSMEGHAATYYNEAKEKFVLNFYSALSDEKRQDAGTTAENIQKMLEDIFLAKKELVFRSLKSIISICDGCAAQYRSGSVCYELMLLAVVWDIPIDRVIQASGHGKGIVDSQSGKDKTLLDMFFDCLVANPEALLEGVKRVETHERDDDGLVSLAKVCHDILSDPDRRFGSTSNSRRAANRKIDERRYLIRPVGAASGEGVKYECASSSFPKGDGIRSNYHIRADPELVKENERPNCIAMRRFPCFCDECVKKMREPIATRYEGPSDKCKYWDVFKRGDGTSGYNDWKLIKLEPKKKVYKEDDDLERLEVAVRNIGQTMAELMEVDKIGAYIADDDRYDYYLFRCTTAPKKAEKDTTFNLDGNDFAVKEGEMYCEGVWLDKVPDTSDWYVETGQKCVVRMQVVVDTDVELHAWSEDNPFKRNLRGDIVQQAKEQNAKNISGRDHAFLMEQARIRTVLDYTDFVYGDVEKLGDDDAEEEDVLSVMEDEESEDEESDNDELEDLVEE